MYNDFAISDAERLYYTNVHKERKEQYEVISHKNHLLYREVLTAFGDHPCCLSLLYHMRKFLSIKNFNGAASGVVFSCRSALIPVSDPDRRAGDSYLSAFRAASPWRPSSRRQAPTPRKPPAAFRFISSISRKPARRASPFLCFRFPLFCAVWAPAPSALALYYILQTYIIMYV